VVGVHIDVLVQGVATLTNHDLSRLPTLISLVPGEFRDRLSDEAHERAIERMVQAGARPMTSVQYLLELQRDWARGETYVGTTGIARQFGGAYGLGLIYAKTMFGAHEG